MTDAKGANTDGGAGGRISPPVIFGASPSLVRVFAVDELPALASQLPEVRLPAPLRLLMHRMREDWTDDSRARTVLLEHDVADLAAAVVVGMARTTEVPLVWISARELVSSELAFPQRAMNSIVRFAVRWGRAVLYVHDFDAIAQPRSSYPSHYARRATHDVLAAMRTADAQRGELMMVTSASLGMLDRSLVIDRFDVAIRLDVSPGTSPLGGPGANVPDVA
jgi:hypothetical protein